MNVTQLPLKRNIALAYALSLLIGLLVLVVSLSGLLFPGRMYKTVDLRDSFVTNDLVNLMIGLPVLLGSMWLTRGGKLAGLLVWPGSLLYVLYNEIAYLVGMPLGWASFLYLALVLLSVFVMLDLMIAIDHHTVQNLLAGLVPANPAGWVLVALGTLFFLRGLSLVIQAGLNRISLPMSEVGVLIADIILSAIWIAGGLLLLFRKPLGYASGLGLLFSGSMLFIALVIFLLLGPVLMGQPVVLADVMVVLLLGSTCFVPFYYYLRGVLLYA
jgi:hypothetical protein